MTMIDRATLKRLWPRAPEALVAAIVEQCDAVFARYGIDTALRAAPTSWRRSATRATAAPSRRRT